MFVQNSLLKINELRDRFNAKLPRKNWSEEEKNQFKIDLTFFSNQLEGNPVSYGDTVKFLQEGLHHGNSLKDLTELKNHKKILDKIFDLYGFVSLTAEDIKNLHRELMLDPVLWPEGIDAAQGPGEYRIDERFGVRELNGKTIYKEYCSPALISGEMSSLLKKFNANLAEESAGKIHPLENAVSFHYEFLNKIHPFYDGNGRMARIILNLHLMNRNFPPLIIKSRDLYLRAIIDSEKSASLSPLLNFFISILEETIIEKLK
jgi:Fic family protein